jgi:hypothetical protein
MLSSEPSVVWLLDAHDLHDITHPPAQMWVDCTGLRSDETRFCTSLSPSAVTFHVSKIRMIARCAQCTIHVNAYCSSREYKLPDNVCFSILLTPASSRHDGGRC